MISLQERNGSACRRNSAMLNFMAPKLIIFLINIYKIFYKKMFSNCQGIGAFDAGFSTFESPKTSP